MNWCFYLSDSPDEELERDCKAFKCSTNADRFRAMTDEELADEILKWFNWLNAVEWDDDRIINWLKQEAET